MNRKFAIVLLFLSFVLLLVFLGTRNSTGTEKEQSNIVTVYNQEEQEEPLNDFLKGNFKLVCSAMNAFPKYASKGTTNGIKEIKEGFIDLHIYLEKESWTMLDDLEQVMTQMWNKTYK